MIQHGFIYSVHYLYACMYMCTCVCLTAVISRNQEGPGEMGKAVLIPKDDQE